MMCRVTDFIATLGADRISNWAVCKSESLWGIVSKAKNGMSNGQRVQAGDRIFVWRSGRTSNGFIAQMEALGPMRFTSTPGVPIPWNHPETFGGIFPIRVVEELHKPERDDFSDEGRIGRRFGFNNSALQHCLEKIEPDIAERIAAVFPSAAAPLGLGVPYHLTPTPALIALGEPFDVDPDVVDRGLAAHHTTVEKLAEWVKARGWQPVLPAQGEPRYDLAWVSGNVINVAEVKSTTLANREMQLRLGLGQVLRYRQQLSGCGRKVKAWLVAENEVPDLTWETTCRDTGVRLTWPKRLQ
jgi:hypothetical protein